LGQANIAIILLLSRGGERRIIAGQRAQIL